MKKIKNVISVLITFALVVASLQCSSQPGRKVQAAGNCSINIVNRITNTTRTDSLNGVARSVYSKDTDKIFTIELKIKDSSGNWYKETLSTSSQTAGMADLNGGSTGVTPSTAGTYYVKTYANQTIQLSGLAEGCKVAFSTINNIYHNPADDPSVQFVTPLFKKSVYNPGTNAMSVNSSAVSNLVVYVDYLVGRLEIKQDKDSEGADFPKDTTLSYKVNLEGSDKILAGREVSVQNGTGSATFAYDENSKTYKASMDVTIKDNNTAIIDYLPIGVSYSVEAVDATDFTTTSAKTFTGTIENSKNPANAVQNYVSFGTQAVISVVRKYKTKPADEKKEDKKEETKQEEAAKEIVGEKTGETVTAQNMSFDVTDKGTVIFTAPKNKNIKSVTIPATIKSNGKTYKVVGIEPNAFKNCKKLTKVVIGPNVKVIGKMAFYGCKNLKKIIIKTKLLGKNSIGSKAFSKIHSKAVFKVPAKKLKVYKKYLKKAGAPKKSKVKK